MDYKNMSDAELRDLAYSMGLRDFEHMETEELIFTIESEKTPVTTDQELVSDIEPGLGALLGEVAKGITLELPVTDELPTPEDKDGTLKVNKLTKTINH